MAVHLGFAIALAFATAADAQTFTKHDQFLLEPNAADFTANGVGSPAVVWDPDQQLYVMLFESRLGGGDATCTWGPWGIGVATSADGISDWTVWPDVVIEPGPDLYRRCVAAHPAVLYDQGTYRIWFKAHQGNNACADGDLPWGCERISGVGYAEGTMNFKSSADLRDELVAEIQALQAGQVDIVVLHADTDDFQDLLEGELEDPYKDLKDLDGWWSDHMSDLADRASKVVDASQDYINNNNDVDKYEETVEYAGELEQIIAEILAEAPNINQNIDQLDEMVTALEDQLAYVQAFLYPDQSVADEIASKQAEIDAIDGGSYQQGIFLDVEPEPVLAMSTYGYPTVTRIAGTYHMLLAKVPDFFHASSANGKNWQLDPNPVMSPGVTLWAPNELYNPALVCHDDSNYGYENFFGGREMSGWQVAGGGWGNAISGNWTNWFIAANAYFEFEGEEMWRHWDVVRIGSDYLAYFSEKDEQGRNRIGIAYTQPTPTWDPDLTHPRICDE